LEFLKYWPSSRDFNKLVIKAKMHAKYFLNFSLLYKDTIWNFFLFFKRLGRLHENKNIFFYVLTKLGILIPDLYLYNIKIQTNIDQNTLKNIQEITNFWKDFFGIFFSGWAGPSWFLLASVREQFTHACYSHGIINL
jgi:hypothetical protein